MKNMRYNQVSKNLRSTQRLNRCFFVPLILSICHFLAFVRPFNGGVWSAQAPRRRRRLEHPHHLGGVSILKTYGGRHG